MMLIGTSLLRCIRSIALNEVRTNDVLVIISRTNLQNHTELIESMREYYERCKAHEKDDVDFDQYDISSIDLSLLINIGSELWTKGKIHQPSAISGNFGYLHVELSRGELWLPVVPSPKTDDQRVVDAYQKYMVLVNLIK